MSAKTIPVACSLNAEELTERRKLLKRIGRGVAETEERKSGYAYTFASDALLPELLEFIRAERQCCPFFRFTLTFEPGNGPLRLEVTGPEGTKAFLRSLWEDGQAGEACAGDPRTIDVHFGASNPEVG
ncbi:MAG: hypothetical protein JWN14_1123 [Chthonomonadales bacterium]|nr:hypothetical protein [Chthonomonadales bacterium]